jgi:hypothetical protein
MSYRDVSSAWTSLKRRVHQNPQNIAIVLFCLSAIVSTALILSLQFSDTLSVGMSTQTLSPFLSLFSLSLPLSLSLSLSTSCLYCVVAVWEQFFSDTLSSAADAESSDSCIGVIDIALTGSGFLLLSGCACTHLLWVGMLFFWVTFPKLCLLRIRNTASSTTHTTDRDEGEGEERLINESPCIELAPKKEGGERKIDSPSVLSLDISPLHSPELYLWREGEEEREGDDNESFHSPTSLEDVSMVRKSSSIQGKHSRYFTV